MTRFTCNVCGAECARPAAGLAREAKDCAECGSSVRLRALIAMLSEEIFGVALMLPEFPVLKGVRGIGMSDAPELASRLADKFDYTNTFYHRAPLFDVTSPDAGDRERYDFILSSEVLEHVPAPVERSFAGLYGMLKPDSLLLMTTPYNLDGKTAEHFPELYEYALASPGGRTVLVNRRRDGSIETFEDLTFHGGHGSTLEMRAFTEGSLRELFQRTGFDSVRFAGEDRPEFGVEHAETWSLPMAARKGNFRAPSAELALEYREAMRLAARKIRDLAAIQAEYDRHIAYHNLADAEWKRDAALRAEWIRKVEADWEERTKWAQDVAVDRDRAIAEFRRVEKSEAEAWVAVAALSKRLEEAQAQLDRLRGARWTRAGRKLGVVD